MARCQLGGLLFITDQVLMIVAAAAVVLALAAITLAIITIIRNRQLTRRYNRLFGSADAGAVQDILATYAAQVAAAVAGSREEQEKIAILETQLSACVQHIGIVRFNPFADTGGDQSFALALADAQGDGLVLSSLHARGLTRIYAKPLQQWASPYQLTDEEDQAIRQAQAGRVKA
jgi:hypothetical protein